MTRLLLALLLLPGTILTLSAAAAPREPRHAQTPPSSQAPEATPFDLPAGAEPAGALYTDRAAIIFWPGDSLRAERARRVLEAYADLPALPPEYPSDVRFYLAPSEEIFGHLTGGAVPEWGAGVAVPSLGRIVIPAYASSRTRGGGQEWVIRHEWAHLALHQYLEGLRIPRWFDEGYAEWSSGGWDAMEGWRLRIAIATGRAPTLDSLTLAWPRDRASAELSYLLSATALEYMTRESGERGLAIFLERWRELEDFDQALRTTYGMTLGTFERNWIAYVKSRYGWLLALSNSLIFWGILALLLMALFAIRRRRDRERMALLRAQEPPDRPAYWMGAEPEDVGPENIGSEDVGPENDASRDT
ncbi:MAG: hypothetical protein WDZ89_01270 [Gemmatimonadota bacterium]